MIKTLWCAISAKTLSTAKSSEPWHLMSAPRDVVDDRRAKPKLNLAGNMDDFLEADFDMLLDPWRVFEPFKEGFRSPTSYLPCRGWRIYNNHAQKLTRFR